MSNSARYILVMALVVLRLGLGICQSDSCYHSVQGKIIDADTKQPLPFVTVQVQHEQKATTTNAEGFFRLENLCSKDNTLLINCVGYCDTVCEHDHEHDHDAIIELKNQYVTLGEIVVTVAPNKEAGTHSIPQLQLKKERFASASSLANALSQVDGVSFISNGTNVQLPQIHGLSGNRILILNNGFKHGFQNWGNDHAPEIDIQQVEKIAVLKGAAGVQYGSEALGGAIITKPTQLKLNHALHIDGKTSVETNGRGIRQQLKLSHGWENLALAFGGSLQRFGDRHAPGYQLTNTGKEEYGLTAGLRYHVASIDIESQYSYVYQNLGLLTAMVVESGDLLAQSINADKPLIIRDFSYDIAAPRQEGGHHFFSTSVNWWYSKESNVNFRFAIQQNDRKEFDLRRLTDRPIIDLSLLTQDYQVRWQHSSFLGLDGLVGIQFFNQNNDNNPGTLTTPFIPNYNTNRWSAFVVEKKKFKDAELDAGLRLDYETNSVRGREQDQTLFSSEFSFANLTGSVGYKKSIHSNLIYRTNLASAWRTPNMAELYSFGQHGFKTQFGLLRYTFDNESIRNEISTIEAANIQPERSYKWVHELEYSGKRSTFNSTFYINRIDNFVFERPINIISTVRGPMPLFVIDQSDVLLVGGEATFNTTIRPRHTLQLGASYVWSTNTSRKEVLINQPPLHLHGHWEWKPKDRGLLKKTFLRVLPSYTFEQYRAPRVVRPEIIINQTTALRPSDEIFDFKEAPVGYALLDFEVGTTFNQFSIEIGVHNVLDQSYRSYLNEMRYFADELGRNFIFSLNYKFDTHE